MLNIRNLPFLRSPGSVVIIILLLAYGLLAYQRNLVWRDDITLWSDCVRKSPGKYRPHNNLGLALYFKKDYDGALTELREVLKLKPSAKKPYLTIGWIYEKTGRMDAAVASYEKALAVTDSAGALQSLGAFYEKQGSLDKALTYYEQALRENPDSPGLMVNKGSVLFKKGLVTEAVDQYMMALHIAPDLPGANYNLGVAYDEKGLLNEAAYYYLNALKANPEYPQALSNLGIIYGKTGSLQDAVSLFEKALRIEPEDTITLLNLGVAYEELSRKHGRKDFLNKAAGTYRRLLMIEPGNIPARQRLESIVAAGQ